MARTKNRKNQTKNLRKAAEKKRERADSFPLLKAGAHLWQLKTY